MSGDTQLIKARAEAALARERLLGSAHELQARLRPGALASDAWDGVKDRGESAVEHARTTAVRHPVAASAAAAGLVALLVRKPLFRLFRRNRKDAPRVKRTKRIDGDTA